MSKCPSWQAIYKGESPLALHLFTSVLTLLSNSCSTMSKCPSWQAIIKVMHHWHYAYLHLY